MGKVSGPVPLSRDHAVNEFVCGEPTLDKWLVERALKNQASDASRTFVVCDPHRVIGYYAIATGSIIRSATPKKIQRNMPEQIPVLVLGRLAVDIQYQHTGVARGLLKDACLRTLAVADNAGVKALLIHALNIRAKEGYQRNGFAESPVDSMTLLLSTADLRNALRG